MKKYGIIILNLLLGIVLFNSCADEDEVIPGGKGSQTYVQFSFTTPQADQISTKSLSDYNLVEDMYVFIFKMNGELDGKAYFTKQDLVDGRINGNIETTTGQHYIYAVANTDNEGNSFATIDGLDNVRDLDDFLAKKANMKGYKLSITGNIVPMVGTVGEEGGVVNITKDASFTIKLKRIVSSIKFNVSCLSNTGKQAKFDLKSYEVVNIPSSSTLVGDNELTGQSLPAWKEGVVSNSGSSQVFDFYMLENIKNATDISSYDSRETKKYPNATENITFANAPANSTYVILRGKYEGDADLRVVNNEFASNEKVNADVSYYVHLGNIGNAAPFNYNNFEARRNVEYTYNITITGVDKLVNEVVAKEQPYDRGDGIISLVTNTFNLDSHYETFNIELNPQHEYITDGSDMSWLSFRLYHGNSKYTTQALMPGEETGNWTKVMRYKVNGDKNYNDELKKGIDGLNSILKSFNTSYPDATSVKITCYSDEYVGWSLSPRSVSILSASLEGNGSKLIQKGIILKQDAINTFFNNSGCGYGVESLNESGRLNDYGSNSRSGGMDDGLSTMKNEVGAKWPSVEEMKKIYAACMSRNRDEDGDGKISDSEMKWYLPAINQYIGLWLGANALGDARLYKLTTGSNQFRYISNTYKNGDKQVLWADQASSTGKKSEAHVTEFPLRCIRNINEGAAPYTYSDNKFTLYLNQEAYRDKQDKGELGNHTHVEDDNKLYKSFMIADNYVEGTQTWYEHNTNANKNTSVCTNYHEGSMKSGYEKRRIGYTSFDYDHWFKNVGKGVGDYKKKSGAFAADYMEYVGQGNGSYIEVQEIDAYVDGRTWRLPNQRELSLMYAVSVLSGDDYTACRTWYAFDNNNSGFGHDGNLRLFGKAYNEFGYLGSKFKIRCVKDVD